MVGFKILVLKTQQLLIRVFSVGNFEEITAFFVTIGLKNTQKSMKKQKPRCLTNQS